MRLMQATRRLKEIELELLEAEARADRLAATGSDEEYKEAEIRIADLWDERVKAMEPIQAAANKVRLALVLLFLFVVVAVAWLVWRAL